MASPTSGKHLSDREGQQLASAGGGIQVRIPGHSEILQPGILDQLHDSVITADLRGNITGCNPAVLQVYGYSREELVGKNIALLYPEDEQLILRESVLTTVLEKGHYQGELRNRTKSGKDIYIHLSVTLLRDNNSNPVGMVGVSIDITEQMVLEFALLQKQHKMHESRDHVGPAALQTPAPIQRQIDGTQFLIASPIMHKFMGMVDRVAGNPEIVLITGETGSGKELIARSIHDNSHRRNKPWVDINCAALPEHLVESELFGYEAGAFSGADSSKPGLFELADKGTLFLDEIGELDPKLQVKLLRVLDGSSYYRLGGHRKITVDVRIVAATNQDLELGVQEGRFRRDLFHRLSQFQLRVPPLRERPEDIVALAEYFLGLKDSKLKFSPDALSALASYSWPGNVRELRNLVAKLAMAATGSEIRADDLLAEISVEHHKSESALPMTNLEDMEEQMIIKALESTGGHRGLAAEQLGISRRTLSRKLREYNITSSDNDKARALGALGLEQQKFFRAKTRFLVSLKNSQGDETNVTAVNLSTGGLGLEGLAEPQNFGGLLDASFLLPESETLIQAKVRLVWADASGRAGVRFVVLEPALYEEIHHWTARKMKEEGWELPQLQNP